MQEDFKKVSPDSSGSIDAKIRLALYDIEVMVENLKVKSIENWQWDIIQRIYDIHSLLSEK